MSESLQDLIIQYRIQEQQKADDDDTDDVNLQRILKQIGISLHKKYRQKSSSEPSKTKLATMIQQVYQTLKKTQPELFSKLSPSDQSSTDDQQSTTDTNPDEEIQAEEEEEENEVEEEVVPLTPEMQHANTLYDQANKLINVTFNRQYET